MTPTLEGDYGRLAMPTPNTWQVYHLPEENKIMKYSLLLYTNESEVPESGPELFQDWMTLLQELKTAGVLLESTGLAPTANATTVRVRSGKTLTTDGPFAETHEQLGGFLMLDLHDLDEAIQWAKKVPHAAYGSVEIRPLWDQIQQTQ